MLVLWGTYPSPLLCLARDEAVLRSHTWWQCCHHSLMILSSSLSSSLPSTTPFPPPPPYHHHPPHLHPHHLYVLLCHTGLVGEAPRSESFQLLLPWQGFKISKLTQSLFSTWNFLQNLKANLKLDRPGRAHVPSDHCSLSLVSEDFQSASPAS